MNLSRFRPTSQSMPLWLQQVLDRLLTTLSLILGWQLDSVANLAGLATVDDTTIPDGSKKVVRTLWDTFTLDKSSTDVVDGITVLATASGAGRWLRDRQPNEVWGKQGTFYVDPLTGDDENTGLTQGAALATFAEVRRRLEPVGVLVDTTIYIVSDLAADDPVGIVSSGQHRLVILGVPTVDYSGTVDTWNKNNATNVPGTLSDASWTVTDHLHKHLVFTSGNANGMGCWILEADFGGAGNARVSTVIDQVIDTFPSSADPSPGDTFDVHSLPVVTFTSPLFVNNATIKNLQQRERATDYIRIDGTQRDGVTPFLVACSLYASMDIPYGSLHDNLLHGGFVNVSGQFAIRGGAIKWLQAYGGVRVLMFQEVTLEDSLVGSFQQATSAYRSSFDLINDIWLFGDLGTSALQVYRGVLDLGDVRVRGQLAATCEAIRIREGSVVYSSAADHSVTGNTDVVFYDAGITIDINDAGVSLPNGSAYRDTNEQGAIGTVKAGIKGNLTAVAGTYYALSDLTESATDIMPYVATNRSFARNLRVSLEGDLSTDTLDVTVLVDGVDSGIKVTGITGNIPHEYSDVANTALVAPGQKVSFEIERTGTAGTATNIVCTLECG